MNKKPSISFFCPAYNDEGNLPVLIPKTFKLLRQVCSSFEIVIVDDASPDRTGKVADKLAKQYSPNVKVIHHSENKGYGGALISGFENAKKYPYIFFTDGDNQYDVTVLKEMIKYIDKYDVVVGNREIRTLSLKRKIQSIGYNKLIQFLFKIKNKDVNCAIRLLKREFVKKIKLSSSSAFLPAEMLIELNKHGAKVKIIKVNHYVRGYGEASGGKMSVIIPTFLDMVKYYFKVMLFSQ